MNTEQWLIGTWFRFCDQVLVLCEAEVKRCLMSSDSPTQSQREASCSSFHFQWLSMEIEVVFHSLFYRTSTAQFLPVPAFFTLG